MQIKVPAEIILTIPETEAKVDYSRYRHAIIFACEQHLNNLGVIKYQGEMVDIGAISFGLRVHMHDDLDALRVHMHDDLDALPDFLQSGQFEPDTEAEELADDDEESPH